MHFWRWNYLFSHQAFFKRDCCGFPLTSLAPPCFHHHFGSCSFWQLPNCSISSQCPQLSDLESLKLRDNARGQYTSTQVVLSYLLQVGERKAKKLTGIDWRRDSRRRRRRLVHYHSTRWSLPISSAATNCHTERQHTRTYALPQNSNFTQKKKSKNLASPLASSPLLSVAPKATKSSHKKKPSKRTPNSSSSSPPQNTLASSKTKKNAQEVNHPPSKKTRGSNPLILLYRKWTPPPPNSSALSYTTRRSHTQKLKPLHHTSLYLSLSLCLCEQQTEVQLVVRDWHHPHWTPEMRGGKTGGKSAGGGWRPSWAHRDPK